MAGLSKSLAYGVTVGYNYTHEYVDNFVLQSGYEDFRTNEHEVVLAYTYGAFTPYAKFTHLNSNQADVKNTEEITLGLSYSF